MYNIVICSTISYIEPQLPVEVKMLLNEDLKYHPAGYHHTWRFQNKKWDGFEYLFDIEKQSFRTGLVSRVCNRLQQENIEYKIIDQRQPKEIISDLSNIDFGDITPYEYQLDASEATVEPSHSVIASPTGTGKTIMMALMVKKHQKRTLIVVNSRTLLDQTYNFFAQVVPGGVGIIGSGDFHLADVTISTIQSIGSILGLGKKRKPTSREPEFKDWLNNVGIVIHDEVHEADNKSIKAFYSQMEADKFIGMTATPFSWAFANEKVKNLEMEQHFGIKAYDSRNKVNFIELGVTVPLYINRFMTPLISEFEDYDVVKKHANGNEYKDVIQAQVIDNDERTELLVKKAEEMVYAGLSCYVFYKRIAYGEKLTEAMDHLDPVMLQGKTPRKERNDTFQAIENKAQLLVISDIGGYGLNIKSLDSIMPAYPARDFRQLKGRVCRAAPGKERGIVLDPIDTVPFLIKHAQLRKNQAKQDNDVIIG